VSGENDLLQGFLGEMWAMISPVVAAAGDPALAEALLARAGIPASAGPAPTAPDPSTIDSLQAYLRKSAPTLEEFVNICETAVPLAQAVRGFINAVHDSQWNALPDEFLHQVIQLLGVPYFRTRAPKLYAMFRLLGLIATDITTHYHEQCDLDRLGHFFEDTLPPSLAPKDEDEARQLSDRLFIALSLVAGMFHKQGKLQIVQAYYGWEPPPDSPSPAADPIAKRTLTLAVRDISSEDPEPRLTLGLVFVPESHGGPSLFVLPSVTDNFTVALGDEWTFSLGIGVPVGTGLAIPLASSASLSTAPDAAGQAMVSLGLERKARGAAHFTDGIHFTVGGVQLGVDLSAARIGFRVLLKDMVLDVAKGSGDGLLQKIFSDGFQVTGKVGVVVVRNADGTLGFDLDGGIGFKKGEGRKSITPVGKSIGGVRIEHFSHDLKSADDAQGKGVLLTLGIRASARLGAFTAILDGPRAGIDVYWSLKDGSSPNLLGLLEVGNFALRPPTGLGLTLNAGAVQGSGIIEYDPDNHFYAGALSLTVRDKFGVDVVGLITTSPFSLLVLGDVRFPQALPLGFGFSLAGVGVLVGLDRGADPDAMSQALQAGNLDALLFPGDPASKPALVTSTLATFFPAVEGAFTIGVLARIVWGPSGLARIDIGFVYDTSKPKRLIALARLQVDRPLLRLKLMALGVLDFDEGELDLQARLFDSRIMGGDLSGDAAVMLRFKSDPCFVLSIGGFHPAYHPPTRFAQKFPALKRLSLRAHTDESLFKLRFECYFAVTSNSVQLGARLEIWAGVAGFSVSGMLAFDALVIWDPELYFELELQGSVSLEVAGLSLLSAAISAKLIGPRSWYAEVTATISILWWDIDVHATIGSQPADPTLPVADGLNTLARALAEPHNWGTVPDDAGLVSLRRPAPSSGLIFHPLDRLTVRQQEVPLSCNIDRLPNGPLSQWWRFELMAINGVQAQGLSALNDSFAPAQYQSMSDAEKLSSSAFVSMGSGVEALLGGGAQAPAVAIDWGYDEWIWTPKTLTSRPAAAAVSATLVAVALTTSAAGEAPLRRRTAGVPTMIG
jgi:hypothetical protein